MTPAQTDTAVFAWQMSYYFVLGLTLTIGALIAEYFNRRKKQ